MNCPNCGAESNSSGSYCTSCGTRLAPAAPHAQPKDQPGDPAQEGYVPPYRSTGPVLFRAVDEPTVKSVHLGGMLFLLSAVLLIAVGLENLGLVAQGARPILFLLLGILAVPMGFVLLAYVVMPKALKPLDQVLDLLIFVMSALFLLWGLLGSFSGSAAAYASFLFAAGLLGLGGMGLKMGMMK